MEKDSETITSELEECLKMDIRKVNIDQEELRREVAELKNRQEKMKNEQQLQEEEKKVDQEKVEKQVSVVFHTETHEPLNESYCHKAY